MAEGTRPRRWRRPPSRIADIAAISFEITGRKIKRIFVCDEEWRDAKVAARVRAPVAPLLPGTWRAARRGDFETADPTSATRLGHHPKTMRDVLAATLKPV